MAQLSRPFQIALAGVLLFAVVWFVALGGHGSSPSSTPAASTPAPTPASTPSAHPAAGSTHIEGITRAVAHAHEAVAASQRAADKSANSSAETPGQSSSTQSSSTVSSSSKTVTTKHGTAHTSTTVVTKHGATGASATVTTKHVVTPAPHKVASGGIPAQQAAVESELKQGKVVLVLFWNPKGADDKKVYKELQAVSKKLGGKIAVHNAEASQVGSFGSITKAIQVYQTPTILLVNGKGVTSTLTGFTDAFSIEQTIDEARQA